jgi:RNA polymerase sigma-70 factor (ECF subfamily)
MMAIDEAERDLVAGARRGDAAAVEGLFRRHWADAFRAAYAVTGSRAAAEDVAQEAFLKALDGLDRFDGRRPFGAWLHRIAVNRAIDEVRSGRRVAVGLDEAPEPATWPDEPWPAHAAIVEELGRLPLERRLPIVLRHWLGLSVEETAELLDVPVGTVASRVSRGLADLRERLEVVHGH